MKVPVSPHSWQYLIFLFLIFDSSHPCRYKVVSQRGFQQNKNFFVVVKAVHNMKFTMVVFYLLIYRLVTHQVCFETLLIRTLLKALPGL